MVLPNNNAHYPDDGDDTHECPVCSEMIAYNYADGDKHCPECGYISEVEDTHLERSTPTTRGPVPYLHGERTIVWTRQSVDEWGERDGRGWHGYDRVIFAGGNVHAYNHVELSSTGPV